MCDLLQAPLPLGSSYGPTHSPEPSSDITGPGTCLALAAASASGWVVFLLLLMEMMEIEQCRAMAELGDVQSQLCLCLALSPSGLCSLRAQRLPVSSAQGGHIKSLYTVNFLLFDCFQTSPGVFKSNSPRKGFCFQL